MNKNKVIKKAMKKSPLKMSNPKTTNIFGVYNIVNTLTTERNIFYALTEKQAIKIFLDGINSSAMDDPKDFQLYKLGTWDKITGSLVALDTHKLIQNGFYQKQLDDNLLSVINEAVSKQMMLIKNAELQAKNKKTDIGHNTDHIDLKEGK